MLFLLLRIWNENFLIEYFVFFVDYLCFLFVFLFFVLIVIILLDEFFIFDLVG